MREKVNSPPIGIVCFEFYTHITIMACKATREVNNFTVSEFKSASY